MFKKIKHAPEVYENIWSVFVNISSVKFGSANIKGLITIWQRLATFPDLMLAFLTLKPKLPPLIPVSGTEINRQTNMTSKVTVDYKKRNKMFYRKNVCFFFSSIIQLVERWEHNGRFRVD